MENLNASVNVECRVGWFCEFQIVMISTLNLKLEVFSIFHAKPAASLTQSQ